MQNPSSHTQQSVSYSVFTGKCEIPLKDMGEIDRAHGMIVISDHFTWRFCCR